MKPVELPGIKKSIALQLKTSSLSLSLFQSSPLITYVRKISVKCVGEFYEKRFGD